MGCINQFLGDMEHSKGGISYSCTITWGGHKCGVGEAGSITRAEILAGFSDENLRDLLTRCVEQEEYEKACVYRDELARRETHKHCNG